jgi:molybdate transport system regulatory protein
MDPDFRRSFENRFDVDPGFVRRKFYERANACGFPKTMGGPEMIRKARAMELMKKNMPLPAIQKMLGHATTYLSQSYESFSEEDIRQVTRLFIEREASSRTSARNSFFGKIQTIRKGSIQAQVTLATISGHSVTTVITNDSLRQLDLKEGRLVKAEIKAPWIILHRGKDAPACSAENRFSGVVEAIITGTVNTEITVRLADGTALCAIVSTESARHMALEAGDPAWAVFNCYAVVLNVDGYDNP